MRKFKKALAFALASAMIVSAVPASAAAKTNSAKGTKSTIYTYTVDKSKKADANNKRSWIKVTAKKGYTYKLVNKTTNIVSLTKTRVEAKKAGTAKINVNFYKNGKYVETKSVKITVKKAPMIGKVSLDKSEITVGETTKVSNAGKGTAYFYSSNKDVATVDKTTGEITAKAAGTTTISAVNTITKARVYLTLTVNAQFAAKQTGSKEITVTGNGFTKDSKISVTKGSQTVTFDAKNVTIAADGKSMTIVTNSNIIAGDYTVKVDDKEATFKGEASKIAAITAGDVAVADANTALPYTGTTSGSAVVSYTVKNQFDEDITKTTNVTVSGDRVTKVDQQKGEITLKVVQYDKEGDLIPVVIINTETGISLSKTVKLSAKSVINEISVKGLYNKDGKTYTEDTAKTDTFYLLVSAKDQYGKNITDAKLGEELLLSVGSGLTNLGSVLKDTNTTETITVDGVEYIGIKLGQSTDENKVLAGDATVLLISKSKGTNAQATITVANGVKVDKFSASPAGVVVAGKDNVFEFTAIDTAGNTIENPTADLFNTVPTGFKFVKNAKTGKTELIYKTDKTGIHVETFITKTNIPVTVQFNVQDKAVPTTIVGVKNVATGVVVGEKVEIKASSVKFEDQYGNEYTDSVDGTVTIKEDTNNKAFTQSGDEFTAAESGDEKVTITYTSKDGKTVSEYTLTLSARKVSELKDYKAEAKYVAKVTGSEVANLIKVTGTATDGAVITLPTSAYSVYVAGKEASVISGSAVGIKVDDTTIATKEADVMVIIDNGTGTEIKTTVKVSNAASAATTVKDATAEYKITSKTVTASDVLNAIKVEDQYGDTYTGAAPRVTFSGYDADKDKVDKNNTTDATLTINSSVNYVTVKYTFANGTTYTRNITVDIQA